jgi:CRISPR-associated endonuclease/helicase Cas3
LTDQVSSTSDRFPQEAAIAHASPTGGAPHGLADHLHSVASVTSSLLTYAPEAATLGHLAGLWHDLGKYRPGFQQYIRQVAEAHIEGKLPQGSDKSHSAAGALHAWDVLGEHGRGPEGKLLARVLQYVIAGHHAGLDNWTDGLKIRLAGADAQREYREALAQTVPESICQPDLSNIPKATDLPLPFKGIEEIPGRFALWLRLLFSALVDADFLDTEAFMDPTKAQVRQRLQPGMPELRATFDAYMATKTAALRLEGCADNPVNRQRAAVLAACRAKASLSPGTYTLSVPTGGGKTLAALAFALTHAVQHGKRRVVMAIPYTSIIEQTAEVYREVFAPLGDDIVIEHHSNAESAESGETTLSRLACENWDAPIIVTTNVQLFESLFARKTSRCRKLHRLTHSVLILDEAQLLPVGFLQPVVDVLRLLVRDHGVTLVLCTATQPVLTTQQLFGGRGLRGFEPGEVTAIIDDEAALYAALQRVRVHLPADLRTPQPWSVTAEALLQHQAVLAIVGRRADARELFELLRRESPEGAQGLWHLSALMCPQHRSEVIADIKSALVARREALTRFESVQPVRVISTQLVEAGVDLDFPVVYRALAGLDSVAQAAGRCNREGRLPQGEVFVFTPPKGPPPGLLRVAAQSCTAVWDDLLQPDGGDADPLTLARVSRYFRRLYGDAPSLDEKNVRAMLELKVDKQDWSLPLRLRDAAEAVRLIDNDEGSTVIVRYRSERCREDVNALIGKLERDGPNRAILRKLQRYGVTLYRHDLQRLISCKDVREMAGVPGLYVQADSDVFYDPVLGAQVGGAPGDPAAFVM